MVRSSQQPDPVEANLESGGVVNELKQLWREPERVRPSP